MLYFLRKRIATKSAHALVLLWTIAFSAYAQTTVEADTFGSVVTWHEYDLPPISIVSGVDTGKGVNNWVQRRLSQSLPGFQRHTRNANFSRIIEVMHKGTETALCVGFQKNPEREIEMVFSEPFTIGLPTSAIVLKSRAAEFRNLLNKDGQLSLDALLAAQKTRIGIASGRSYAAGIDHVLANHKGDPNIIVRHGADISVGLLGMLAAKRFDFTIMYPEEAQYTAKALRAKVEFASFPLSEALPFATVHVVAPHTASGKTAIAEVNPIILKFRDSADFHHERELWMDGEARKRYRKLVSEVLHWPRVCAKRATPHRQAQCPGGNFAL